MSDIGALLAQAKLHNLRLNNLYQIDDGTFKANWRRDTWFSNVISGWGATAVLQESLDIAIKMAPALKSDDAPAASVETASTEDIFG